MKRIRFVLLTASMLFASNLSVHAQSPQQSSDQTRPDSSSTKQPAKRSPGSVATPAKDNSKNSTTSTASATASSSTAAAPQKTKPAKNAGMVWVNTESGVYHRPGSRWYGKTKQGKYMPETDAIKAGYKVSGRN